MVNLREMHSSLLNCCLTSVVFNIIVYSANKCLNIRYQALLLSGIEESCEQDGCGACFPKHLYG